MRYLIIYLLVMNCIAFLMYGLDKRKAEKDRWRIPEFTLIVLAVLGGSVGALAGMLVFHHKTKKPKFVIGVPLIFLLQTAALIALMYIK